MSAPSEPVACVVLRASGEVQEVTIDQRKVNMLAREYCDYEDTTGMLDYLGKDGAGKTHKPVILSHHMLAALDGRDKMSKSNPDAAIFMEDTQEEVNRKIKKAFCPEKQLTVTDEATKEVLKNGCMCCAGETPGSELERVLDQLLKMRRDAGTTPPFDYVLIETSGLADVAPIIQVLWRHEMERSPYYLDGVVAVVDCAHILRHLRPSTAFGFARRRVEAERQLSYADRVVLNKLDTLPEAAAAAPLCKAPL